jgi:multisubunit Na+/H+ antiporter MnhB subunit
VIDFLFLFDLVLGITLIWFAVAVLSTPDLFKAIVLFIILGLLMSITWGRLDAVDIALAEAAIGAGITGALLLNARGDLEAMSRHRQPAQPVSVAELKRLRRPLGHALAARSPVLRGLAALLVFSTAAVLAGIVLALPLEGDGLWPSVQAQSIASGAENPVTAVLLNFRAYDTLLEIAVLLFALIGAWSQGIGRTEFRVPLPSPVLLGAVRRLVPVLLLIGGYLLWMGTHAAGGAFQAGAVLAGGIVLLILSDFPLPLRWGHWPFRLALALGVLVFAAVGLLALQAGLPFLHYRGAQAAFWITTIELAATGSIALTLAALFSGRPPPPGSWGRH